MNLISFVQEASLRIFLVLLLATPTTLFGWFFCRRWQASASSKVKLARLLMVKSLAFDVLFVGVLGQFTSCLSVPRFWAGYVPDFVPALIVNAYLVGSLGMLAMLVLSLAYAERIRMRAAKTPSPGRQQAIKLLSKLGGRQRINVRESSEVHCLSLAGLFRPTIIIPAANPDVKQTEVLHEISHVINRDLAWTLLAKFFQVALFPLPWTHWLVTEVILWQEIRADEAATRSSHASRLELAESILQSVSRTHTPLLSMSGQGKNVARRLNSLYKPVKSGRSSAWAVPIVFLSMAPLPAFQIRNQQPLRARPGIERIKLISPGSEVYSESGRTPSTLPPVLATKSSN